MLLSCASLRVIFQQVIHALRDDEEDAELVHKLDQLANYVDALRARDEVDAFFSIFLFEGSSLEDGCARDDWVTRFFCVCEEPEMPFDPRCRSVSRSTMCRVSRFYLFPVPTKFQKPGPKHGA